MPGAEEFYEIARRLSDERGAAIPVVDVLRRHLPLLEVPSPLPPAWCTLGMVHELCSAVEEKRSVPAGRLVTTIADALDPSYPRVLRSQARALAWRTLGDACRESDDAEAALHAFAQARTAADAEPALVYERASIDLGQGRTLAQTGTLPEARHRILSAMRSFHELRLSNRAAECNQLLLAIGTHDAANTRALPM